MWAQAAAAARAAIADIAGAPASPCSPRPQQLQARTQPRSGRAIRALWLFSALARRRVRVNRGTCGTRRTEGRGTSHRHLPLASSRRACTCPDCPPPRTPNSPLPRTQARPGGAAKRKMQPAGARSAAVPRHARPWLSCAAPRVRPAPLQLPARAPPPPRTCAPGDSSRAYFEISTKVN